MITSSRNITPLACFHHPLLLLYRDYESVVSCYLRPSCSAALCIVWTMTSCLHLTAHSSPHCVRVDRTTTCCAREQQHNIIRRRPGIREVRTRCMGGARDRRRLVTSVHHAFYRWVAAPALLLFSLRRWDTLPTTAVEALSIIGLTLPQGDPSDDTNGDGSGGGFFFPLSEALASAMKLAVDDLNAGGFGSQTEGNLTLSVFGVNTGTRVMEGLCDALEIIGEKGGTFGVSETRKILLVPRAKSIEYRMGLRVYSSK